MCWHKIVKTNLRFNNLPLWHECQQHLIVYHKTNLLKYNIHTVHHIYKTSKLSKFCKDYIPQNLYNSPWVDLASSWYTLSSKILILCIWWTLFLLIFYFLPLWLCFTILFLNSPFDMSPPCILSPLLYFSPFLTLMSKGLYRNCIFVQKTLVDFHDNL